MRYSIAWFVAALAVLTSGCGTVCNLADDHPQVYGGVHRDIEFLATPGIMNVDGRGAAVLLCLWAADLCVSGVADTMTIPVLYFSERRARERFDPLNVLDHAADQPQYSVGANAPPYPASQ
jgi:uncharacterized protein YceK